MERNNYEPSLGLQNFPGAVQALFQRFKLVVDRDSQGLKSSRGRMYSRSPVSQGHGFLNDSCQMKRCKNFGSFSFLGYGLRYPLRESFFAVLPENFGNFFF